MADYPDLPLSRNSRRTIVNGTQIDRADDGTPWIRNFYTTAHYVFNLIHEPATTAQCSTLQSFYEAQKLNQVVLVYKEDGVTYDCYFISPPQIGKTPDGAWSATVNLSGRVAP